MNLFDRCDPEDLYIGDPKCNALWKLSSCWDSTVNRFSKWRRLWSASTLLMERTLPSHTQKAWEYHLHKYNPETILVYQENLLKRNSKICSVLLHGHMMMHMVTFYCKFGKKKPQNQTPHCILLLRDAEEHFIWLWTTLVEIWLRKTALETVSYLFCTFVCT